MWTPCAVVVQFKSPFRLPLALEIGGKKPPTWSEEEADQLFERALQFGQYSDLASGYQRAGYERWDRSFQTSPRRNITTVAEHSSSDLQVEYLTPKYIIGSCSPFFRIQKCKTRRHKYDNSIGCGFPDKLFLEPDRPAVRSQNQLFPRWKVI
jgi:hypothetical protein